ncbi:hypothetical protein LB465_05725 [Salegentibacter sp. LM13S]|uniref:hypothetical protein n=1 Tax=Salegentibacter lacus TaxID=2873599 RepID=UPI001CCD959F|nr:hypothetical protein [Salegentibacter lacus]MBZ9630273.1 hypothetical protein [Salegentibacter lacus]
MKKEKAFETIIVLALAALICFLFYQKIWLIYLSVALLVIPIISVKVTLIIAQIWFGFSNYLALVMNYVLMFICFYLFLVPLSFLQRLFGGNQILKKQEGDSYFHKRNHLFTSEDINKPW